MMSQSIVIQGAPAQAGRKQGEPTMKSRCPHLAHRAVWRRLACATLAVLVAACGDGGTAPEPPPPPNRAPVASGTIPAQTLTEGQSATVNVAPFFSDPDGDALSFTASTSNAGVAAATVSGSTVTITAVAAGTATITVTARDPGGLTAALSANVAVEPANRAPVVTGSVPPQSLTAGQSVQVNLAPFFSDPDGDALTYTAASSNTAIVTASVSGSTVTITAASVGSATITVSAADPGGLSASLSASVMVGTAGAPDLVFTGVMPTSINGSPGETVMATFTLRNRGNAASPPTTIRLMQSDDATISTADTEINSDRIDGLPAGGEGTIEVSLTLPQDASGTFYGGLCVDPVSGESNTSNNCSTGVRVTVGGSGGPDLVVSVSPSSVTVSPGGSFSYDVTVRNQGDASSAATEIQTYASDNSTISTSDTPIDDPVSVPSLDPSEEAGGTATFTVGATVPLGTVYFGECVDAVPGESNTNNNCSSVVTVTIEAGGGGGGDRTYTTGETIETLPTGFWFPDTLFGGSFQVSGGVVTIQFNGTSSYLIENNIRYSCLSSGGCEIVNRLVTRGTIRANAQSSSSLTAEPELGGWTFRSIGTSVLEELDGDSPVPWVASASIRVLLRQNE